MITSLFIVVLGCLAIASQYGSVPPQRGPLRRGIGPRGRGPRDGGPRGLGPPSRMDPLSGRNLRGDGSPNSGRGGEISPQRSGSPRSSGGPRRFLSRKDQDFVGEDPVLSAELARRIAVSTRGEIPELKETPTLSDLVRLCHEGMLPSFDCPPRERDHEKIASARRQHLNNPVEGEGHSHKFKQFPEDYNATNLYATQLKIAEHAIYATQARIEEFERVTKRHQQDDRFRIAYLSSKVEGWSNDLSLLYDYSHRNLTWKKKWIWVSKHWWYHLNYHQDPYFFSIYKHVNYYQLMLRRYLDILYTLQLLRDTHDALYKNYQATAGDSNLSLMQPG